MRMQSTAVPYPKWLRGTTSAKQRKPKQFLLIVFSFLLSFLNSHSLEAQNCTSNDVRIISAYLSTTIGGEIQCTGNELTDATLHLIVSTKTPRQGVFISGDLYIDGTKSTTISNCFFNALNGSNNDLPYNLQIPCPVGKLVELKNVFVAWGTGADQFCPSETPATPSKCRFKDGEVIIVELLGSGFTFVEGDCTTGSNRTISFTGHASGGTAPYTYDWYIDYGLATQISFSHTDPTSSDTDSPSHDFLSDNDYAVTLVVTDNNGNVKTTTHTVAVTSCCIPSEDPTSASATYSTICSGGSTTLSVVGGSLGTAASWQWYTGGCGTENGGTLVHTGASFAVSPTATTTYYVRAEGECGTTACVQITVTVNDPSTAPTGASATSPICNGSSTILTQTGGSLGTGAYWQWYSDNLLTKVAGQLSTATASLSVSPLITTTYYVRAEGGTSPCGATTAAASVTVVVNQPSVAPSGASATNSSICPGGSSVLSFTGGFLGTGATWQWYRGGCGTENGGTSAGNGTSITVSPTSTTTYYVRAEGTCNNTACASVTVTVNPNMACAVYNGVYFANTGSTNAGGSATVTLVYNISPYLSASCHDLSSLTKNSFTVTSNPTSGVNVIYASATYSGGVYTVPVTIAIPSNQYSTTVQFTLGFSSGNYLFNNSCLDIPLITVSSNSNDFVTGGGFVIPSGSYSKKAGSNADGQKNNLGFNVKWTKSMTQLQGNFNTIIRRIETDGVHLYQVKSANPGTLVVTKLTTNGYINSYRADITYTNANIQDLTLGSSTGEGPGTVYLTVIDNGEPGSNGATTDQVLITVKDKSNVLWYTSSQSANTTVGNLSLSSSIPLLNRGNMQVHTSGGKAGPVTTRDIQTTPATLIQVFELRATPNPTHSYFTLQLPSQSTGKVSFRVIDVLGRVVEAKQGLAPGTSLRIGNSYKPGIYIVEVLQGDSVKQVKLVKQ